MNCLIVLAFFAGCTIAVAHEASVGPRPWLGTWESSNEKIPESQDSIVRLLGLPLAKFGGNPRTILIISKHGDEYSISSQIPGANLMANKTFKFGEEGTAVEYGTEVRYKYTENGQQLKAEIKVPSRNKVVFDTYSVSNYGNELIKEFSVDNITGKKWFRRIYT